MPKAVVIIPTYNERDNIERAVGELLQVFATVKDWELAVLVVDDTSPDKTYQLVERLAKRHPNVKLLMNPTKSGLGGAYLKGMAHAFGELAADVVFEFDADLSHDPAKIPKFLTAISNGADMVLGSRYIKGGGIPQDWGLHRKFLSVVGNIIIMAVLTEFSIRDWTTGFRAITKKVYQAVHGDLTTERFSGYTFQIGFLHKTVRRNFKVVEEPFVFVDRTHGHSKLGPEYVKNTLLYIFRVRLQEILAHRVFKFAVVGGIGAVVQLLTLALYRQSAPFQLAFFLSVETAVATNFVLNNAWTFADRQLKLPQVPVKFLQFNLASAGSIIIQQIMAIVGEFAIGLFALFTLPLVGLVIDTGMTYAVVGILIGMFWNFFAYNYFIWKKSG